MLRILGSSPDGLTDAEAQERLRRVGPNTLQVAKPRAAWRVLLDQLRSAVVLLLAAATAISWLLGERAESVAIAVVLIINTTLGFVIEMRARRAMHALLPLEVPRACVVRSGRTRDVDARELVPSDVIQGRWTQSKSHDHGAPESDPSDEGKESRCGRPSWRKPGFRRRTKRRRSPREPNHG